MATRYDVAGMFTEDNRFGRKAWRRRGWRAAGLGVAMGVLAAGAACAAKPSLLPNRDPALRRTVAEFRADAATRSYPADAPRGRGLEARSQIGYMAKRVDLANLSQQDWENVEVWVNRQYVVFLPRIERGTLRSIPFTALFDRDGNHMPTNSRTFVVETVEVLLDGQLYDIRVTVAL